MAITLLVSLGVGVIVIAAGGLIIYMSALVKNAYQLKVEMQQEMQEQLQRINDDADKKLKWMKRDLVEEIEKSKNALIADNARRFGEFEAGVEKRLAGYEDAFRRERMELLKSVEAQKGAIAGLDQKLRQLQREQRRLQMSAVEAAAPVAAQAPDGAPAEGAEAAVSDAAEATAAAPAAAPAAEPVSEDPQPAAAPRPAVDSAAEDALAQRT